MTFLIGLFARWGVAESLRGPLAALTLLALAVGALMASGGIWLHFHDRRVIAQDRAAGDAAFAKRQIAAEREAGSAKAARDAAARESIERTQEDCDEANRHGGGCLDAAWGGLFD